MIFKKNQSILFLLFSHGTPLFRASYKGRFQHLKGATCSGPPPILRMSCAEDIEFIETSHPTIECSKLSGSEIGCNNTCDTQELCSQIWTDEFPGTSAFVDGSYGEVSFSCTGEIVDAKFVYEDSGDGRCGSGNDVRNFHVAQLGIFCSDIDDFSFDGNSFECVHTRPEGSSLSATVAPATKQSEGVYTCVAGESCRQCEVSFEPVVVEVDEHRLREECIVSLDGAPIPDAQSPEPVPSLPGIYTALFQANWAMTYWVEPACSAASPTWIVKCLNGQIELSETLFDTVSCRMDGDDTLECTETSDDNFSWGNSDPKYSGIIYSCTGANLPETSVAMPSVAVTCNIPKNQAVSRLKLGVLCTDLSPPGYQYIDPYFECIEGNSFELPIPKPTDALENQASNAYTCITIVDFPESGLTKSTDPVGVYTDFRWSMLADPSCYSFDAAPTNPPTNVLTAASTTPPTTDMSAAVPSETPSGPATTGTASLSPTSTPSTNQPTNALTAASTSSPTTVAPVAVPTKATSESPSETPTTRVSSSSPTSSPSFSRTTAQPLLPTEYPTERISAPSQSQSFSLVPSMPEPNTETPTPTSCATDRITFIRRVVLCLALCILWQ